MPASQPPAENPHAQTRFGSIGSSPAAASWRTRRISVPRHANAADTRTRPPEGHQAPSPPEAAACERMCASLRSILHLDADKTVVCRPFGRATARRGAG